MSAHTSGPWRQGGSLAVLDSDGARVAQVGGVGDESKANVRLIAAAPEMLEALHEITDAVTGCRAGGLFTQAERKALETVRTVIAKAEGRP